MISTVVVPLDGTDNAVRAVNPGIDLARRFRAGLALFGTAGDDPDEVAAALRHRAASIGGCPVETIVHQGFESSGLARAVEELADPVVCMASDVGAGPGEAIGPVAEDVLDAGLAPVLLVGPAWCEPMRSAPGERRILVCADGSAQASTIEPVVAEWATGLDLDVHLVTVVRHEQGDPADIAIEHLVREVDSLAFRLRRRGLAVTTRALDGDGDAAHAISRYVDAHPVALVAASARGHRQTVHAVVGATVERLVRATHVPVLVASPAPRSYHA